MLAMKMRKIILASLMVATVAPVASPVMAQENGWFRNRTERPSGQARSQPQPQSQPQQRTDDGGQRPQAVRAQPVAPEQRPMRQNEAYRERTTQREIQRTPQPRVIQSRPVEARRDGWQDDRNGQDGRWRDGRWQSARQDDRRDDRSDRRQDWRDNNRNDDRTFSGVINERRVRVDNGRDWRDDRRDDRQDWRGDRRDGRYDDRSRWANQRRWDNGWRNDRRYDWRSYRNHNGDVYRAGRYYAPRGYYGYRSFSSGFYADSILYSQNYWIDDPYSYRLPPAYGSMRWIRYYDDALLVDMRDGYVVDVIRNFFW